MALRVVAVAETTLELWRDIHNQIIPTAPLTPDEVAERSTRHRLTLAYDDDALIGNATLRPPGDASSTATVIVRVLPPFRSRGFGTSYLDVTIAVARELGATRIETVVLASNTDGLAFALSHGFVEHERYTLEGDLIPFIDLHLVS